MVDDIGKIKIKIAGLTGDAPALAKILNCVQYNGNFGCIHCLNAGEMLDNPRKHIFRHSNSNIIRTNETYRTQVQKAIKESCPYEGVKGSCWISKYIDIPEQVALDFMHLTCLGTVKKLFDLWLFQYKNKDNELNDYYFSQQDKELMDSILLNVKYPSEISRSQRSIKDIKTFKANEFRNLIFYTAVPSLKSIMNTNYYTHFVSFVTAIRLLTQEDINKEDLEDAYTLIEYFLKKFEAIYGDEHLDYKLHAHSHLAAQCIRFGPLNSIACFSLEGVFMKVKNFIHGKRGHVNQIIQNIIIEQTINEELDDTLNRMADYKMKSYMISANNNKKPNVLKKIILFNQIQQEHILLMKSMFTNIQNIVFCHKTIYKNYGIIYI